MKGIIGNVRRILAAPSIKRRRSHPRGTSMRKNTSIGIEETTMRERNFRSCVLLMALAVAGIGAFKPAPVQAKEVNGDLAHRSFG